MKRIKICLLVLSGLVLVGTASAGVETSGKNLTVTGFGTVQVDGPELQVDVKYGARAALSPATSDAVTVYMRESSGDDSDTESWKAKVGLWLDASKPESFGYERDASGTATTVYDDLTAKRYPAINYWYDRRTGEAGFTPKYCAFNERGTALYYPGMTTYTSVMPYVMTNEVTGLPYVSTGDYGAFRRRIYFWDISNGKLPTDEKKTYAKIPVKAVISVFGSQRGGGYVMNGLKRNLDVATRAPLASDGIFDGFYATTLDGVPVDPENSGFKDGWQVFSFTRTASIDGFGVGNGDSRGGQYYAEILIFTSDITAAERRAAERYLAKKWGLEGQYQANASVSIADGGNVRLYGKGSAVLDEGAKAKVGGTYEGHLTVASGAEVTFGDEKLAPTNPAWIATAPSHSVVWYDPNRQDVTKYINGSATEPNHILSETKNLADRQWYPLVGDARGPYWRDAAYGFGPTNRWFDYAQALTKNGSVSRFVDTSADGYTFGTRTGFMVVESSSGGTLFLDTTILRDKTRLVVNRGITNPIFVTRPGAEAAFVTNSPAFLNGYPVKSGEHRFNDRAELLSFKFSDTFPVRCFGDYVQGGNNQTSLRHGEIIFTSEVLSETQRKDTEAYLMKKWLGVLPEGYGDPSKVIVSGAGVVKLPALVARPQFADDFTGTVILKEAVDFVVDATNPEDVKVRGAIVSAGGTVSVSPETVLRVTLVGGRVVGKYTLVDAASILGEMPSIEVIDGRGVFNLEKIGNSLVLSISKPGIVISVR